MVPEEEDSSEMMIVVVSTSILHVFGHIRNISVYRRAEKSNEQLHSVQCHQHAHLLTVQQRSSDSTVNDCV